MIRKLTMSLIGVILAIALTIGFATRDDVHSEALDDKLQVITLTVNNAKIYLVRQNGKLVMIDSGNPGDESRIEGYMREAGIDPATIDYLILTHGHLDHLGTAAYFQRRYGVTVIGGRADSGMFARAEQQPLCATSLLARAIDMSLRGKTYPLFEADILVDQAYDLAQLGLSGKIIPMPGHTLGTLLVGLGEVIFVGDLIRGELLRQHAPTRHFFMCDLADNDRDIRTVLEMVQYTRWYTGHFGALQAADIAEAWSPAQ